MRKNRFFWRLFISFALTALLAVTTIFWLGHRTLRQFYYQQVASDLAARARLAEPQFSKLSAKQNEAAVDALADQLGKVSAARMTVISTDGIVSGDSERDPQTMDNHINRPEVAKALVGKLGVATRYSKTLQQMMMYVAIPLNVDGKIEGVVRVSLPLKDLKQIFRGLWSKLFLAGALIFIALLLLSLHFARRISRPLAEIRDGVERYAQGDLSRRLPIYRDAEVHALAESINLMAAQLQERINAVSQQRNEQQAVLASMVEGVLAVDAEERLLEINRRAAELFGIQATSVRGLSVQEAIRNSDLQRFIQRALKSETAVEEEIVLLGEAPTCLQAHGTVLRDGDGHAIGASIVLNDVTRLRRLERVRRDFVANVSHELKTPLTSMKGSVETLLEGAYKKPKEALTFLQILARQAERLNAIIEDLLSLSRIEQEAEKGVVPLEQADICQVIENAVGQCRARAEEKGIELNFSCADKLSGQINPLLLENALVNLIDNAIKYSNGGKVVDIRCRKEQGQIQIDVEDQGIGLEPQHQGRVFERFYRVDKARSRKQGGTGLGLSIVKHIAEAHGGSVSLESQLGRGSTFILQIPLDS